ncbi:MAG: fibronectin type III domain-containing protein [Bacteroidales bacterium]|jgi:predicted phosphodiesterase|nr:fibronectin type III domain-containing protein [Bacteroidales bacterium]
MKQILIIWNILLLSHMATFSQTPYNIVINVPKNPTTEMAFNWFTTLNTTNEQVQIVIGATTNPNSFTTPFKTANATTNQNVHKAVVADLSPNTTYSFRVGKTNLWSTIATFTTAPAPENKVPFSFIYVTDAHAEENLQPQTNAANIINPNASFWMHCGDVGRDESSAETVMLERWKKFFEFQPNQIQKKPLAPVMGNHDVIHNNFFHKHFNVQNESFDTTGSTYSFIYGDAQFFAINTQRCHRREASLDSVYFNNLKTWMETEIMAHPNIKWRIVYYHIPTYTSKISGVHNSNIADLFDELNIDLALQGHTHVHDVMGPIKDRNVVQEAIKYVTSTTATVNSNGKSGGIFNVQQGTMYFTNGAFGLKWMPLSATATAATNTDHITGKWAANVKMGNGIVGFAFSNISVSSDNITITTYKANNGVSEFLDEIKIVKECIPSLTTPSTTIGTQTWNIAQDKSGNITIQNGITLTVTANITALDCSVITIQNGGQLVVNGGTLDGFTVVAQSGSACTIQNNGKILLKNFDDFDIQLGATLNLISGEVSPK